MLPAVVCVTGAAGFLGSHVVKTALDKGYSVHATVRDTNDAAKTDFLRRLAPTDVTDGQYLKLFSADLTRDGSFDEAIAACDYVIHVAAVVKLVAKHPQSEIVDPAVKGVANVLRSCQKAGSVKRVVVTSSVAAVFGSPNDKGPSHVFSEEDWNETSTLKNGPYMLAKTLSERAAWSWMEEHRDEIGFDLVAINPAFICGPTLNNLLAEAVLTFKELLDGKYPGAPHIGFAFVDVRDCALSHVLALTVPEAAGQRLICAGNFNWLIDVTTCLRKYYPQYKLPKSTLPNFLMYVGAIFDKRLSFAFLRNHLNAEMRLSNEKIKRVLGIRFRTNERSWVDTCESLISIGCVAARPPPANFVKPELPAAYPPMPEADTAQPGEHEVRGPSPTVQISVPEAGDVPPAAEAAEAALAPEASSSSSSSSPMETTA